MIIGILKWAYLITVVIVANIIIGASFLATFIAPLIFWGEKMKDNVLLIFLPIIVATLVGAFVSTSLEWLFARYNRVNLPG